MTEFEKEEKELINSYERGEWESIEDAVDEIERHRNLAGLFIEKLQKTRNDWFRRSSEPDSID